MSPALTKNILITGHAGSGKSFLQTYLKTIGVPAYDMDTLPQIAQWVDKAGKTAVFSTDADESWFKNHRYAWNREEIKVFLQSHEPCVLLGLSDDDAVDFKDLFDVIAYLKVPAAILGRRLASRENFHGKTQEQRERVLTALSDFDAKAEQNEYVMLDATKSPEEIWKNLTDQIEAKF